jgi:hypothetical protein
VSVTCMSPGSLGHPRLKSSTFHENG